MSEELWQRHYGARTGKHGNVVQYGMLIDLSQCLGCHTCQILCKTTWTDGEDDSYWSTVTTRPFGGKKDAAHPNLHGDVPMGAWPDLWQFYLPETCNHCAEPACLRACPVQAIYKRKDGIVLVDRDACTGAGCCTGACPYGNISISKKRKAHKCILCFPLVEQGLEPVCVSGCTGRARIFGDLMDPESAISKVIRSDGVDARPWIPHPRHGSSAPRVVGAGEPRQLRPEHGTRPSIWYVLPKNVPAAELEKYFGPAPHDASGRGGEAHGR